MVSKPWLASDEVVDLANELIANHHSALAGAEIAYVMKQKATPAEAEQGLVCTAKKITPLMSVLCGEKDFVVLIAYNLWNELSSDHQRAMLDSALCSCSARIEDGDFVLGDDGHPIWTIKNYDVVAHSEILMRYGVSVLQEAGKRIKEAVKTND
jgi:hypothetical protein